MHEIQAISPALQRRKKRLTVLLLCIWLAVSFGPTFFARTLSFEIGGWPVHFWMAAQGAILVFIGIVVVYAFLMNRWEAQEAVQASADHAAMEDSVNKKSV
jgi:putative solute:sodium symporter small subunit